MHSRPPDRRPDGRLLLVGLLLVPLLPGLGEVRSSEPSAGPRPGAAPPAVVWIFPAAKRLGDPEFIAGLEALGVRIRARSRWLQALSGEVPSHRLPAVKAFPGVEGVRPVATLRKPVGAGRAVASPNRGDPARLPGALPADSIYGELGSTLERLQIPTVHDLGFSGAGVRVGILDGFFLPGHAAVRSHPPLAQRDFVDLDGSVAPGPSVPPEEASPGTALWSLVAGDDPFTLRGAAPGVQVLLARVRGRGEVVRAAEDRWVEALEWMETQGARIVVSGVTFRTFADFEYPFQELDGDRTPATVAADEAARRGILLVTPVGNGGQVQGSLEAPADGDSVLAVGAVDAGGLPAPFSGRGPTADGRPKPDLLAPGVEVPVAWAEGDQTLRARSGTEVAGGLLAGGAALLVEAYPDRGPMEILEVLRRSAFPDTEPFGGVPRMGGAVLFPEGVAALALEERDGEGRLTNLAPRFRWDVPSVHPLGLPVTFRLELASDEAFDEILFTDSVVGTFARRLQEPLLPRDRFFWRVEARSVQGLRVRSSVRGPLEVPPWITLEVLDDPGGSEIAEPRPEFRWSSLPLSPPAGPFTYELQVVSDRREEVIQTHSGIQEESFRLPAPLPFNLPLRWRIIARARQGPADTVTSSGPFVVTSRASPPVTILYQNFPNPFPDPAGGGEVTHIWFDLARRSEVELAVYDVRGRLIRSLVPAPGCGPVDLQAGEYGRQSSEASDPCVVLTWEGKDDRDRKVPPGVYLLRLQTEEVVDVVRIVFWP